MLSIIDEVHHEPALINDEDEFPADKDVDLSLSIDAAVYYQKGKPFLQRYLPFELASIAERLLKVLIPMLLLAFPILKLAPLIYNWHIRNRIHRCYHSLVEIEKHLNDIRSRKTAADFETMINELEKRLDSEKIPLDFSNEVYVLREHIELVHRKISKHLDAQRGEKK
jgi:hypothetical protein